MTFSKISILALAVSSITLLGCNESPKAQSNTTQPTQVVASQDKVMQTSLLQNRIPATCFVKDSDNLAFCMIGDTLIYERDAKKEEQATINEVIGNYCDVNKPYTINGESVICSFHQNRTYNANPVNQRAIVASNIQTGRDYLAQVATIHGIQEVAPGLYVLPLKKAPEGAPAITRDVAVQLETKLLTPDLRVHSYMLDDLVTLDGLAQGNPFAQIFPSLKKGDVVRVYIDFAHYPNVWNVDSSLQGLPYIWEINVLNIGPKPVVNPQQVAPAQQVPANATPATDATDNKATDDKAKNDTKK